MCSSLSSRMPRRKPTHPSQLLSAALRTPSHRTAVAGRIPPAERGRRRWERPEAIALAQSGGGVRSARYDTSVGRGRERARISRRGRCDPSGIHAREFSQRPHVAAGAHSARCEARSSMPRSWRDHRTANWNWRVAKRSSGPLGLRS